MNLDSRFSSIDRTRSEAAVLPDFDSAFGAVAHALKRPSEKKHVLGFMLFGYAAAFVPGYRPGEPPRLLCSSPLRWYGVSDDPTDEQLFWQFTEGWLNRLPARMQTIADRGFTGLL